MSRLAANFRKVAKMAVFKLVNNTGVDISMVNADLLAAVDNGVLPDDLSDIFELKILKGFNDDGSDRGILTMKEDCNG